MNIVISNKISVHKSDCGNKSYNPSIMSTPVRSFVQKNDEFCPSVNFRGKTINKKMIKTIEVQLRNLEGVHDPYSDVELISKKKYQNLQYKICRRPTSESMIKLLSGYKQHMFPDGEARVFDFIVFEVSRNPKSRTTSNFHEILQEHLPEAKTRLVANELNVTDYMRDFAKKNFSKPDQKIIEERLDKVEQDILEDKFRIKPAKAYLEELYFEISDKKKVKEFIKITNDYPSCATSVDAFIVKNADKSHEEIAEALISPAYLTVEHNKPQSKGGETKPSNLIAASRRMNNLRGSMDYDDFIEMFPRIPQHAQRYADDLISKINRGGIVDIGMALPDVKECLKKESHGAININISRMHPKVFGKVDAFKSKIGALIDFFGGEKKSI